MYRCRLRTQALLLVQLQVEVSTPGVLNTNGRGWHSICQRTTVPKAWHWTYLVLSTRCVCELSVDYPQTVCKLFFSQTRCPPHSIPPHSNFSLSQTPMINSRNIQRPTAMNFQFHTQSALTKSSHLSIQVWVFDRRLCCV